MSSDIKEVNIDTIFDDAYANYGVATVKERAIPSIEDGLNPVTRRILYTFHNEGYSLRYRKAAAYVGNVLGNYHPHGDNSLYQTMVGLSQPFAKLIPIIEAHGNNGSINDAKSFAAQRYLEMRMSAFTRDTLLKEMNPSYITMQDNYDNTKKEPKALPSMFPMVLHIGNQGIASGFASELPTHSVGDVCDITIKYINNPDIKTKDLVKNFRPDFASGAVITNEAELPNIYESGKGVIRVQAEIEETKYKGKDALIIKSLPYKVSTETILVQIGALVKPHPKTKELGLFFDKIQDIRDISDFETSVGLVILPKKDTSLSVLRNLLLENTSLRSTIKYLPNVLYGNELVENAPIKDILKFWLESRVKIIARKTNFEISSLSNTLLLKKALHKALGKIDAVIAAIKTADSEQDAISKIRKLLSITETEAKYIVNIRLHQISRVESKKLLSEIKELQEEVDRLIDLLGDKEKVLELIKSQLKEISKKYSTERKTSLTNIGRDKVDMRSLLEEEDLVVAISSDNYVYAKKPDDIKEHVTRGAKGANFIDRKYKRIIREMISINSHDDLFVFTNTGKVIEIKGYQLDLWNKPISHAIPDLGEQEVVAVIKADPVVDATKSFVFITKNSLMKRVLVDNMISTRKMQGGNIAIKVMDDDELIDVSLVGNDDRLIIASNLGRMQNLQADMISVMTRPSSGYPRATLGKGERIHSLSVVPMALGDDIDILVATKHGVGKLVAMSELPVRRGDSGRRSLLKLITLKKGDEPLQVRTVSSPDAELIAITSNNKTTRISTTLISRQGRNAQGVKLMTLEKDEELLDILVVE